jgi:hypothetical protein
MPSFYDDAQYGVRERFHFRNFQVSKNMTADTTLLKRFYPKGPIKLLKFGVQHIATQGGTEVTVSLLRNSSTLATVVASTDSAPWTIASKAISSKECAAGSYLTITTAGTVATGSVICFIDFVRSYSSNWDV